MTPLTPEAIAEIRARVEAATPGPWETSADAVFTVAGSVIVAAEAVPEDIQFIAAARSDVPRLLDAHEELQEENERLYDLLFWISEYPNRCAGDPEDQALNLAVVARKGLSAEDSA